MANIKSAKKRVLVSQAKADRNKSARSKVKTYIKKVESAVAAGDKAAAQAAVVEAESVMRKAASKGVYHDNTVSRKISRMNKAVNAMNYFVSCTHKKLSASCRQLFLVRHDIHDLQLIIKPSRLQSFHSYFLFLQLLQAQHSAQHSVSADQW